MRRRLLVPVDGSAASHAALALAELIPSRSVHLLRTESAARPGILDAISDGEFSTWRTTRESELRDYLDEVAEPFLAQGRDVELTTAFDEPAAAIVRESANADLIVMGPYGRGGAEKALIGSVADRVVRHAPTATLLVRGGDSPAVPPPIGRIVVPLDGSKLSEQALPAAIDLASDLGVPIHLVRVTDNSPMRDDAPSSAFATQALVGPQVGMEREIDSYLSSRAMEVLNRDERATWESRMGQPAAEIVGALKPGDLIVMTTHAKGGMSEWLLGSVANRLVREVSVPILLLRPNDDRVSGTTARGTR